MKDSVVDLECDHLMQAAEVLQKEAVFSEVAVFGNLLHLVTADADTAIPTAKEKLSEAGIRLSRIEVITPSLEDVFVTLTARRPAVEKGNAELPLRNKLPVTIKRPPGRPNVSPIGRPKVGRCFSAGMRRS